MELDPPWSEGDPPPRKNFLDLHMSNNEPHAVFHMHYDNTSIQYIAICDGCKNVNFQMTKCDNFLIFAQNIDRGYKLEPPQ